MFFEARRHRREVLRWAERIADSMPNCQMWPVMRTQRADPFMGNNCFSTTLSIWPREDRPKAPGQEALELFESAISLGCGHYSGVPELCSDQGGISRTVVEFNVDRWRMSTKDDERPFAQLLPFSSTSSNRSFLSLRLHDMNVTLMEYVYDDEAVLKRAVSGARSDW